MYSNYCVEYNPIIAWVEFRDSSAKTYDYWFLEKRDSYLVEMLLLIVKDQNTLALENYFRSIL